MEPETPSPQDPPLPFNMTLPINASKFEYKYKFYASDKRQTREVKLPLSERHSWTIVTLESSSFAVTRPPHISLVFDLILSRRPFQAAYFSLRLVPSPAVSMHCLVYRPSPAMKRKKCFVFFFSSRRTASRDLPLSRHGQTDKCKISIIIVMMMIYHINS